MLTQTRHQLILSELEQAHVVSLQDLMAKLSVSESTIRRDLSQLEEAGRLVRVRGGAKRVYHLDGESRYHDLSYDTAFGWAGCDGGYQWTQSS